MFEKLESAIMVLGEKLNNNKILMVLRDSFMLAFPLTIFGSIMLVIANFPYLGNLIGEANLAALQNVLGPASTATMSVTTIFVTLGIGYYLCKRIRRRTYLWCNSSIRSIFIINTIRSSNRRYRNNVIKCISN